MKKLQPSTVVPSRRAKRRHYDQAFKRHLVELTLVPDASVARIALDHRINANILFRWRRHYLRGLGAVAPTPAAALLPVAVSDPVPELEVISQRAPSVRARSTRKHERGVGGVIEVELAAGQLRVSGSVDLEALRLVLEAFSQR